jgi:methyl farnesoate epoxidase / farnesoate epoxidase
LQFSGPRWLPIIGNILLVQQLLKVKRFYHLVWQTLSQQYGAVVGLRLGNDRVIIVSGREAIKEFYANELFDGRPDGFFFRVRSFDKRLGVVFVDGKFWEQQRRFTMKIFKQLGMGKSGMVHHIQKESVKMVEHFRRTCENGEMDMHNAFDISVLNTMWTLLAGYRFDLADERLLQLMKLIHDSFRIIDMSGGILNQFPAIRHIMPDRSGYRPLVETLKPLWKFLNEVIREQQTNKNIDQPNSLIEAYVQELQNENCDETFTEEQLLALCLDLFQAGSETTSNTLSFGIIYLIHNPRVQVRLRKEMDAVIGRERLPCLNDRPLLPYTEATICEIQRLSTVAPLGIVHRNLAATTLAGHFIPKNTLAIASLYSLHLDQKYWGDPFAFRPERFLDNNGVLMQHEYFMPFGAGKEYNAFQITQNNKFAHRLSLRIVMKKITAFLITTQW